MSTPGTLNYPTSLDDSESLLNAAATLMSDIYSGTITIVDSTAPFTATRLTSGALNIDDRIIYSQARPESPLRGAAPINSYLQLHR